MTDLVFRYKMLRYLVKRWPQLKERVEEEIEKEMRYMREKACFVVLRWEGVSR